MIRLLNIALVFNVLVAAFVLYTLEHATRATERRIAGIEAEIGDEQEVIKLLEAEWSSLTRPARLQEIAEKRLGLKPILPTQMVGITELGERVPEKPLELPPPQSTDPIGDILQRMQ
jgi:cell division protein FtsL